MCETMACRLRPYSELYRLCSSKQLTQLSSTTHTYTSAPLHMCTKTMTNTLTLCSVCSLLCVDHLHLSISQRADHG